MEKKKISLILLLSMFVLLSGCSQASEKKKTAKTSAKTKVFHLYAGDITQELSEGTTLYSWGFGLWDEKTNKAVSPPSIPGPEIRVKEGEHVKIVFHNQQKEPHTIHFHGVDNSFKGDGTPGISQDEVKEGDTYTYEFDAPQSGTYFYHCHVEPDRHPEMGLYGAFIVEPEKPKEKYDKEFTLMLGERDPKLSLAEGSEAGEYVGTAAEHEKLDNGEYDTINWKPQYYTINGKINESIKPLKVKKDGTYLIRLINAGSEVHSIHTHGHHFKVIATDGRPLPKPLSKDVITLGPGERYDIVFKADNPGVYPLHCHMGPHGTHGMHTNIVYGGYEEILTNKETYEINKMLHELAEMKEFLYTKDYEKIKVELGELSGHFDKVKGQIDIHDKKIVQEIEKTGEQIAKNLATNPNPEQLEVLFNKMVFDFNHVKEMLAESGHH